MQEEADWALYSLTVRSLLHAAPAPAPAPVLPACMCRPSCRASLCVSLRVSLGEQNGYGYGWLLCMGMSENGSVLVTVPQAMQAQRLKRVTGGRNESSLRGLADSLDGRVDLWLGNST